MMSEANESTHLDIRKLLSRLEKIEEDTRPIRIEEKKGDNIVTLRQKTQAG